MNLLLFGAADRRGNHQIEIRDERLVHLRQVLRSQPDDSLRVGEIGGLTGAARVVAIDDTSALLNVDLQQQPPAKLDLTLVLALPRPKMLRRILRTIAELGVPRLHLIHSYRVEKSYWQSPALAQDKVRRYFLEGLQQARDTILPECHLHTRFKPFVEDELKQLIGSGTALLAHPGDHPPVPTVLAEPTLIMVGPEGGFIPYEVDLLELAGCQTVSMGARILRVETAVTALLARAGA